LKKPPTTYRLSPSSGKANNVAVESDWYDKFIHSDNVIFEKPPKQNKNQVKR
jgi:hypothetical protein